MGAQGKAEQRLGGAERRLGRVEGRLGRAGEAAELCGAAELFGAQGKAEQRLGGVERQSFWVFPLQHQAIPFA